MFSIASLNPTCQHCLRRKIPRYSIMLINFDSLLNRSITISDQEWSHPMDGLIEPSLAQSALSNGEHTKRGLQTQSIAWSRLNYMQWSKATTPPRKTMSAKNPINIWISSVLPSKYINKAPDCWNSIRWWVIKSAHGRRPATAQCHINAGHCQTKFHDERCDHQFRGDSIGDGGGNRNQTDCPELNQSGSEGRTKMNNSSNAKLHCQVLITMWR